MKFKYTFAHSCVVLLLSLAFVVEGDVNFFTGIITGFMLVATGKIYSMELKE